MLYGNIARVLTPVLAVATIGLGVWGYQENQEKNKILIKAENQYQRAFHDLAFHMDQLQDELGKTLAINSRRQIDGTLSNVWRISSLARSDVGQLPLSMLPFNKTQEFLAGIGDFSYNAAVRDLAKEPLNEKEYEKLKTYHKQAMKIQQELRSVQDKVINQQLRWMDVELSLASAEASGNHKQTILDGFKTIDRTVDEYTDLDLGPGINTLELEKRKNTSNLKGDPITADEAKRIALKFVGVNEKDVEVKVVKSGKGHQYQAYSVSMKKPGQDDHEINLDITHKGGHVVWLLDNRTVKEAKMDLTGAKKQADAFLQAHQYEKMDAIVVDQYNHVAVINYAYTENGVRVYPDLVTVKVALDTGNVVGFQAEDYIFNHKKDRKLPSPKLTQAQARKEVNPNLQVQESRLALILNDQNQETLCYEFMGKLGKELYRVFINAEDGEEVAIEKLDGPGQDR